MRKMYLPLPWYLLVNQKGGGGSFMAPHFHSTQIPQSWYSLHGTPTSWNPLHRTPFHGTPLHRTPFHRTPFHGIPLHGTPSRTAPRPGQHPCWWYLQDGTSLGWHPPRMEPPRMASPRTAPHPSRNHSPGQDPPVDRQTPLKHYLPATSFADGNYF